MAATQVFTGLPKWAQGTLAVGGAAAVALIGYKVYQGIKERMKTAKERATQKEVNKDIEDLKKQGVKPTLTKADIMGMADSLKTAFDGLTTDNDSVFRIFEKLGNELDLVALKQAFGVREINSGVWLKPNYTGTLDQILIDEMSGSEIQKINSILAKNGIKKVF